MSIRQRTVCGTGGRLGLGLLAAAMVAAPGCEWLGLSEPATESASAPPAAAPEEQPAPPAAQAPAKSPTKPAQTSAPEGLIRKAIEQLRGEAARLQIVGRPIFPPERKRLITISTALPHLQKALGVLEKGVAEGPKLKVPDLPMMQPVPGARTQPAPDPALKPAVGLVRQALDSLGNESASIQVVGRKLFPKEEQRVAVLDAAISELKKALDILGPGFAK